VGAARIEHMFEVAVVDRMPAGAELARLLLSVDRTCLDAEEASCWVRAWDRCEAHGEAARYEALARYAALHPPDEADSRLAGPGGEHIVHPGGAGTPAVGEFAITNLAVATHATCGRAHHMVGDGLDLTHRMPLLFARLRAGEVAGYKVRMVLRAAHALSPAAAKALDQAIAGLVDKIGPKRLEDEVTKILIRLDPTEAEARAKAAGRTRRVSVSGEADGLRGVFGYVDAFAGLALDAALDTIATMLADLGDTRVKDVRRAAALGWLANPVATLALVQRHRAQARGAHLPAWPANGSGDPTVTTATTTGQAGDSNAHSYLRPGLWPLDVPTPAGLLDPALWPAATVYLHLDQTTWSSGHGPADLTGHGPITAAQALEHLRHANVVIKPVIDLTDDLHWTSTDGEFTGSVREAVWLANRWNPFPYADATTRDTDDADHTLPRSRGGPTRLDNGGPLRRRLHRHKTFAKGWRVKQPYPALFVWQSPHGRIYVCDRRGHTHDLGTGTGTGTDHLTD
jgi:Domain of unknown function (DUF222)